MIITVDSSQATNKSSALLNKQYGLVETISSATAISRNSYSFADDISDDEPEIKRITFGSCRQTRKIWPISES